MKIVNGGIIPTDIPLDKLTYMMESSEMKIFVVACEALLLNGSHEAYELLKEYIACRDRYRRRYVLSVIYNFHLNHFFKRTVYSGAIAVCQPGIPYNTQCVFFVLIFYHCPQADHIAELSTEITVSH